jgi:hypothetical protein
MAFSKFITEILSAFSIGNAPFPFFKFPWRDMALLRSSPGAAAFRSLSSHYNTHSAPCQRKAAAEKKEFSVFSHSPAPKKQLTTKGGM